MNFSIFGGKGTFDVSQTTKLSYKAFLSPNLNFLKQKQPHFIL